MLKYQFFGENGYLESVVHGCDQTLNCYVLEMLECLRLGDLDAFTISHEASVYCIREEYTMEINHETVRKVKEYNIWEEEGEYEEK